MDLLIILALIPFALLGLMILGYILIAILGGGITILDQLLPKPPPNLCAVCGAKDFRSAIRSEERGGKILYKAPNYRFYCWDDFPKEFKKCNVCGKEGFGPLGEAEGYDVTAWLCKKHWKEHIAKEATKDGLLS